MTTRMLRPAQKMEWQIKAAVEKLAVGESVVMPWGEQVFLGKGGVLKHYLPLTKREMAKAKRMWPNLPLVGEADDAVLVLATPEQAAILRLNHARARSLAGEALAVERLRRALKPTRRSRITHLLKRLAGRRS